MNFLGIKMQHKIGILTLSASDNCGSLLQAYALKEIICSRYKKDVDVINFESIRSKQVYNFFSKGWWKHPKRALFMFRNLWSIRRQKNDYHKFRTEYLSLTKDKVSSYQKIKKLDVVYDIIIVGSDQVWNINMFDFDKAFLLPWFSTAKKIAYAPSLGSTTEVPLQYEKEFKKWISDFDYISVRENSGKKTLESLISRTVDVVADPTLLLDKEKWNELAGNRIIEHDYIFYYSWSYSDDNLNNIVRKFSKDVGLQVYVINPSKWYKHRADEYDFALYTKSGPIAFLNLMKYAKFVFVQSFHGAVFANVFSKNFAILCESEQLDFRINSIVNYFNEQYKVVRSYEELDVAFNLKINQSSKEYDELLQRSFAFLDKAIY